MKRGNTGNSGSTTFRKNGFHRDGSSLMRHRVSPFAIPASGEYDPKMTGMYRRGQNYSSLTDDFRSDTIKASEFNKFNNRLIGYGYKVKITGKGFISYSIGPNQSQRNRIE